MVKASNDDKSQAFITESSLEEQHNYSPNFPAPENLNTKQTARYLQCSKQWLEIGRVRGYGPKYVKFGRMVRYRKHTLDEYLNSHEISNTGEIENV